MIKTKISKNIILFQFILFLAAMMFQSCKVQSQPGTKVFSSTHNRKAYELYNKSSEYMMNRQYNEAEILLNKAIKEDSNYIDAYLSLSNIYYKTGKIDLERKQYEKVISINPNYAGAVFNLGHLLMRELNYADAKLQFDEYLKVAITGDRLIEKALSNIIICNYRDSMMKNPVPYNPVNIGSGVNSKEDEYWPVMTADEQTLYFTRKIDQNPEAKVGYFRYNEDIYFSILEGDSWSQAKALPNYINTVNRNEGAIAISPDGTFLLFTICSEDQNFGYGVCDIYYSEYKDGQWQPAKNIGPPINTAAKETQPSISFDGKTIYFCSNRGGTLGKLDLWKSTRNEDGTWGKPVNLGPGINTAENQQSPFIHPDDKTLYYSSETLLGMGSSDLFVAKRDKTGLFVDARNLGYPINTDESEISIFVSSSGSKAFIASRRDSTIGGLDIYSFELDKKFKPEPVCYLKGTVYDKDTKVKLGAIFELIDLESGKLILKSFADSKTGKFLVAIPADKDYALNVSYDGYLFYSANLPLKNFKAPSFKKDVPLIPIKVGEKIILNNIFFDFDKANILSESETELKKVISFMNEHPNISIEIGGHTDNKGSDSYNLTLSNDRAKSVYEYLVNTGKISAARLSFKGYGETMPIESNDTEEGRSKNRRTEFKVTKM